MDSADPSAPTRRTALGAGVTLLGSLAGCASLLGRRGDADATSETATATGADGRTASTAPATQRTATSTDAAEPRPLHVQTSGGLWRVVRAAAFEWNRNPLDSEKHWAHHLDDEPEGRLADYFATGQGIEPTEKRSVPPVPVLASGSTPEYVARDLATERIDLGSTGRESAASVAADLSVDDRFTGHPIATAGSAFVVSPAVRDAGVTSLTADEIRSIYAGEIENWRAVGGPDRDIYVLSGADASPPRWLAQTFFDGMPRTGVDERRGHNSGRIDRITERDDVVADVQVGFAVDDAPALDVSVDGRRYGFRELGYPSTAELRLYTWGDSTPRERAFVGYLQSPAGQEYVERERDLLPLDGVVE